MREKGNFFNFIRKEKRAGVRHQETLRAFAPLWLSSPVSRRLTSSHVASAQLKFSFSRPSSLYLLFRPVAKPALSPLFLVPNGCSAHRNGTQLTAVVDNQVEQQE